MLGLGLGACRLTRTSLKLCPACQHHQVVTICALQVLGYEGLLSMLGMLAFGLPAAALLSGHDTGKHLYQAPLTADSTW